MLRKLRRKIKQKQVKRKLKVMFDTFDSLKTHYYPQGWHWIDRTYIEDFLEKNRTAITGTVLEFKNNLYINQYGHDIQHIDIMTHPSDTENKEANIIGDLTEIETLPENKYDCIICTQVLPFIYDFEKAIVGLKRMLKPGGTLLVSVPGLMGLVATHEMKETGHFWGFSGIAMRHAFQKYFKTFEVVEYGNAKAALLQAGFADSTLLPKEVLLEPSPDHIISVCVKAVKEK